MNTIILISSMGLFGYANNNVVMDVSKTGRYSAFRYSVNIDGTIIELGVGHRRELYEC